MPCGTARSAVTSAFAVAATPAMGAAVIAMTATARARLRITPPLTAPCSPRPVVERAEPVTQQFSTADLLHVRLEVLCARHDRGDHSIGSAAVFGADRRARQRCARSCDLVPAGRLDLHRRGACTRAAVTMRRRTHLSCVRVRDECDGCRTD